MSTAERPAPKAAGTAERLAHFAELVEWSADAIVVTARDATIRHWNRAAERLFGYSAAEAVGQSATMLAAPDRVQEVIDNTTRLRTGVPSVPLHTVRRRKDGVLIPVSVAASPVAGPDGQPDGLIVVYRDITHQLLAESALNQSEESYRTLVEHATYGIYRSTVGGRFLAINAALVGMLGYESADELMALDMRRDLYATPADRDRAIEQFGPLDIVSGADVNWRRRDGTVITVHLSGRTVHDASGAVAYFEMIAENVTERRALEAQLRRAQKMEALGQLTAGIAHDFNNLLTVMQSSADFIASGLPEGRADLLADVEAVRAAVKRGASLVKKLLAFGRREMLHLADLDLGAQVQDLTTTLRRLLPEHIEIRVHAAEGLPAVRADAGSIEQIIINLATNARDAMPQGGVLRIELQRVDLDEHHNAVHSFGRPGHYVCVAVSDTGVGMDQQVRARAFDPFFTTKAPGSGTGLGLATVYSLMQQHEGFVHVYSEVGQGSTFRLYFPTTQAAGAAAATHKTPGGGELILVVEDEQPIRRAAQRVLEKFGYRVIAASDGQEALELLSGAAAGADLVLTDVIMPRMGGRALYDAVRAKGGRQKFLFASGYTARDVHESVQLSPEMNFLSKPWTLTDLTTRVRAVLDSPDPAPVATPAAAKSA